METQLQSKASSHVPARTETRAPIEEVCQLMRRTYGRDISAYEGRFLEKSFAKRQAATPAQSASAYLHLLSEDRAEANLFLDSLNITYSEFFRSPLTFAHLEQLILPNLLSEADNAGRAEVRVWIAGCASGQEAWSVAMLLKDLSTTRGRSISFRIFATDISAAALDTARAGAYDQASVQNVRLKHLREYFLKKDDTYTIAPWLRSHVEFSRHDLLDGRSACPPISLYGDFDLILCCNLLLYYRADHLRRALDKISRALAPGGFFVTGEAEREIVASHPRLRPVSLPAAAYRYNPKTT